jgi:hypothetical protein
MAIVDISAIKLKINANQTSFFGIIDGRNQNSNICGMNDMKRK